MATKKVQDSTSFEAAQTVRVKKSDLSKILTCSICNKFFKDPVNMTECLDIFCKECISKKITEDDLNSCPVCDVYLGCMPLEKIRPDKAWSSIRAALAPLPGQPTIQDEPAEYKQIEQSKEGSGGKVVPSQGSAMPITNPHKSSVEERLEGSNFSMNLNHSDQSNGQQRILSKDRRRSQKIEKRVELAKKFLKRLDDMEEDENIGNIITTTASEGNLSNKTTAISKCEVKSSEKNLKRPGADVAARSSSPSAVPTLQPTRKTDNTSNQHAKRVVPVWLSLVPAVNQEGGEVLPQIPSSYLVIKDRTLPVLFIKKYLVQKLQLNSEDEVEISLCDMKLSPDLEIQHLIQMWSRRTSEKMPAVVGDSAQDFVMVLSYVRK